MPQVVGPLLRAFRHLAIALVLSSALGFVVLISTTLGTITGVGPDLGGYRAEILLTPDAVSPGATAPLLTTVRGLGAARADVEARADGSWLVVGFETREARSARLNGITDTVRDAGWSASRVELGSALQDQLAKFMSPSPETLAALAGTLPLVVLAGSVGFVASGWWFRRRYPHPDWESTRLTGTGVVARGLVVAVAAFAVVEGGGLLLAWLGAPPQEQGWILVVAEQGGLAAAGLFVLGVAAAPLGEELFFRGHLFRDLAASGHRGLAYAFSAGAFAAAHGANLSAYPIYVGYGLILAWAFERWRAIGVTMIAHAVINAIGLAALIRG